MFEPTASDSRLPFGGVARIPAPYAIDADWEGWRPGRPFEGAVWLLGRTGRHAKSVVQALESVFERGVGRDRVPLAMVRCTVTEGNLESSGVYMESDARPVDVRLTLRTPLRIVRQRTNLRTFCLPALTRDLNIRLAAWGTYQQGLAWMPHWSFLSGDANAARVAADETRWVWFRRYSARQQRPLLLGGLLGEVRLTGVTLPLLALLRAAEVMGAGKGRTIGLGRVRVEVPQ
ncbi:MAG TPA: CRISPR system precrRNA processing endoribonuclease RAMP protein Cas6 [Vicinamibacterales bacterium]|nr:CRISPR system precrRNA processing endoribonuclease RAMP protein Cas6 [Vicinamibacterales bacterium]